MSLTLRVRNVDTARVTAVCASTKIGSRAIGRSFVKPVSHQGKHCDRGGVCGCPDGCGGGRICSRLYGRPRQACPGLQLGHNATRPMAHFRLKVSTRKGCSRFGQCKSYAQGLYKRNAITHRSREGQGFRGDRSNMLEHVKVRIVSSEGTLTSGRCHG